MAINPFGGVEPDDDEEQSEMHKIVKTVDGRLHVFPRDASDLDLERFQWRYDNGQDTSPSANVFTPQPLRSFADANEMKRVLRRFGSPGDAWPPLQFAENELPNDQHDAIFFQPGVGLLGSGGAMGEFRPPTTLLRDTRVKQAVKGNRVARSASGAASSKAGWYNGILNNYDPRQWVDMGNGVKLPPLSPYGMLDRDMTASQQLVDFLKRSERGPKGRVALQQYPSLEGGSDTVGWGHKIQRGEDFSGGVTADQAEEMFQSDLAKHQRYVLDNVTVPLTQYQFDALVSLAYNYPAAFTKGSDLLTKLNSGDYAGAADEFARFNQARNKKTGRHEVVDGLTKRRARERRIFVEGVYWDGK